MKKLITIGLILVVIFAASWVGYSLIGKKKTKAPVSIKSKPKGDKKEQKAERKPDDLSAKKVLSEKRTLYFAKGSYLKIETRTIENATPENTLRALMQGPKEGGNNFIPNNVRLLSLGISKGEATVNFSKEILDPGNVGAEAEELTVYSIVNTLTEFKEITSVTIQIEGKTEGEIDGRFVEDFWGHIGLYDQPFRRNESLTK